LADLKHFNHSAAIWKTEGIRSLDKETWFKGGTVLTPHGENHGTNGYFEKAGTSGSGNTATGMNFLSGKGLGVLFKNIKWSV